MAKAEVQAAEEIYRVARQQADEELAKLKQGQAERERQIAECYQFVGRLQANRLSQKFLTVSNLVWLNQVKKNKIYKGMTTDGTWPAFCNHLGFSDKKVDEDLQNLTIFGEEFLLTCQEFSIGYRDLRKLRQLSHDGAVVIDAEYMVIGEERIPLDGEHKEELQAAIENLVEQQAAMQAEVAAQKKAFDRVQADTHKSVTKLQKELDRFTKEAEEKGFQPGEASWLENLSKKRTTFDGLISFITPEAEPLPADATPRMKAAYLEALGYMRRTIEAVHDTAVDLHSTSSFDDDWVPPPLRAVGEEG